MGRRLPEIQKAYDLYRAGNTNECDFCILKEDQPQQIMREGTHFYIVFARFPYNIWDNMPVEQHLMAVPKRHVKSLREFDDAERKEFMDILTEYEFNGYSVYSRAPQDSSRTMAHVHTHMISFKSRDAAMLQ